MMKSCGIACFGTAIGVPVLGIVAIGLGLIGIGAVAGYLVGGSLTTAAGGATVVALS